MTSSGQLLEYLESVGRRLRKKIWARGLAVVAASTLVFTIALSWLLAASSPTPGSVLICRVLLAIAVGITVCFAIVFPIRRQQILRTVRELERTFPAFNQRITTFLDRHLRNAADPFLPLLAGDALTIARQVSPEVFFSRRRSIEYAAAPLAVFALLWLILAAPGAIGFGARALWTGASTFGIEAKTARKTLRRGSDAIVTAHVSGFSADGATLLFRQSGSSVWKSSPMIPTSQPSEFAFRLAGLQSSVEYFVKADGVRSPVSRLNVVELPGVRNIRVTYPANPEIEETDGDVIAPAGTVAHLEIETDRPMESSSLTLEEGDPVTLPSTTGNKTFANLRVLRDDNYHVSLTFDGDSVPVSEEYAVEVLNADSGRPHSASLLQGIRSGSVPVGYERAVAEYYRKLRDQEKIR
jgi:hypothetical protein